MRYIHCVCILILALASSAYSQDTCTGCHFQTGVPYAVSKSDLAESVHGHLACIECHIMATGYPHAKTGKVNCGICHYLGRDGAPKEQALQYKLSIHGPAQRLGKNHAPDCTTCHGTHDVFRSAEPRSRTYRWKIPELCSRCHLHAYAVYRRSIHGKALFENRNTEAPTCFDCHLEHRVPPVSEPAWKLALINDCGQCHQRKMTAYRKTYHGKVTRLGYAAMAKCSDCHGSHDILPSTDAGSRLSAANILATCRACHPRATAGFTKFYAHAEELDREKYPELFYPYLFMTLLLVGVFVFFFTHTFLWSYRALKERMKKKGGP